MFRKIIKNLGFVAKERNKLLKQIAHKITHGHHQIHTELGSNDQYDYIAIYPTNLNKKGEMPLYDAMSLMGTFYKAAAKLQGGIHIAIEKNTIRASKENNFLRLMVSGANIPATLREHYVDETVQEYLSPEHQFSFTAKFNEGGHLRIQMDNGKGKPMSLKEIKAIGAALGIQEVRSK